MLARRVSMPTSLRSEGHGTDSADSSSTIK
jgi:hypothetical protein